MSRKRKPVAELARDICWAGFSKPPGPGITPKQYWDSLPAATQSDYIKEARHFIWLVKALKLSRVAAAVEDIA